MTLAAALDLRRHRLAYLVGAGGKTTALFTLARELDGGVVLTTTTRMFPPPGAAVARVLEPEPGILVARVERELEKTGVVFAGAGIQQGKVVGLDCSALARLAALASAKHVIVEADGSRGRPLKFPACHEPAVCAGGGLVVVVAGMDGVGMPLAEANFHRPQLACRHLGVAWGEKIAPWMVAGTITHPLGYGRLLQSHRVVPLLNKLESSDNRRAAQETADILLAQRHIDTVILATLRQGTVLCRTSGGPWQQYNK